jgi:hypothetical protein
MGKVMLERSGFDPVSKNPSHLMILKCLFMSENLYSLKNYAINVREMPEG